MTHATTAPAVHSSPWREVEIELEARLDHAAPYLDVEAWADFSDGQRTLRRPAFWDGGRTWRVRFASPRAGVWSWTSEANVTDAGLASQHGTVVCEPEPQAGHAFYDHGFWSMSPGGRNLVHADGTPGFLVADTAWALPFRATPDQVRTYAADRAAKGFNGALLMSVQPDMLAEGPRERGKDGSFAVGFEDLPEGHLDQLNPSYFQELDQLITILVDHGIAPIYSPVFQGFGWKGLQVAGTVVPPEEYARYCTYLVARYGARPAIYLAGADGSGETPQVAAGGAAVHAADAYGQPTGVHYQPHAWNRSHQTAEWLDFQWCQTGHEGEHIPERVADMWRNTPAKGVANGEPTYEHSGIHGRGEGWWQGHEAWSNLCAGGTMGVVYGAGSLWQWRLHPDEPDMLPYFLAGGAGWREALEFEGATYVGLVGKIMRQLPFLDMEPDWTLAVAHRALHKPGEFLLIYREHGGGVGLKTDLESLPFLTVIDPRAGTVIESVELEPQEPGFHRPGFEHPAGEPRLYLLTARPVSIAL
jgi:hypothetical protein